MIVQRVEHPEWLSNAYLVAEGPGGHGLFIDSNGLTKTLEERAERDGITITHVLCTHSHPDHVVAIEELAGRHGVPLLAQSQLADGEDVESGKLRIRALYTPGHCEDHVAFLVNQSHCFSADVLFRGTVGGTSAPDGDLAKLKHSILGRPPQPRRRDAGLPRPQGGDNRWRRASLEPVCSRVARWRRACQRAVPGKRGGGDASSLGSRL
jgi:glyoxylase-like metal-dependent hydrolase (beta-lactamase superfamily II)